MQTHDLSLHPPSHARRQAADFPTPAEAAAIARRRAADWDAFCEGFSKAGLAVLLLITGCHIMGVGL